MTTVFWPGLIAVAALYALIFVLGVVVSKRGPEASSVDELLLAGRSLPLWVGLATMTATWVGGGYINGTAENTFKSGLLWGSQAGLGYALSLLVGGLFYARLMRRHGFTTLVDPLESRYGRKVAAVLMIPAVIAEVCWSGAILYALGTTFGTILGLAPVPSILISASIAIAYTVFGGLRAVAFTDVAQLALILIGLGVSLPFVVETAGGISALLSHARPPTPGWQESLLWSDYTALLILGGIPWNVYFQRVLSAPNEKAARDLSLGAGVFCLIAAIPPMVIGVAGLSIDWAALGESAGVGSRLVDDLATNPALILPYTLRYAVPTWIGVVGLGAVSAAVMSSVDSSLLSGAALLMWNGWARLIEPDLSPARVTKLVRIAIVVLGAFATALALGVQSVAGLWYLCGDIVFCVLFPQLTLALFDKAANGTGAVAGLLVAVMLRFGSGDATLGLPGLIPWPAWEGGFPFRTLCMLAGLITAVLVSRLTTRQDPPTVLGLPGGHRGSPSHPASGAP